MFWVVWAVLLVGAILVSMLLPKPKQDTPQPESLGEVPTAKEGDSIPVLFGTKEIKNQNVVWYGDFSSTAIKKSTSKKG